MTTDGPADRPREQAPAIVARSPVQRAVGGGSGEAAFVIQFILVWLGVWIVADGPMRVPFIRWRFDGGRLV